MRTPPLIVLVMLLLQTSSAVSQDETDCRVTVERSSKNQTERLMNQYDLGQIGGLEFEQKRSAILTEFAVAREVCEQKISPVRAPASVDVEEESDPYPGGDTDLDQ